MNWMIVPVALVVFTGVQDELKLTDQEVERLHRRLQPDTAEPWRTIPWKLSLSDAAREAARQGKPILMTAHWGHLLGSV